MVKGEYIHKFSDNLLGEFSVVNSSLINILSGGHYVCDRSFFENNYYKSGYYMIYVESGYGYIETQHSKQKIYENTMFFMDLSKPYKIFADKQLPWKIHWLLFTGQSSDYIMEKIMLSNNHIFTLALEDKLCNGFISILDYYLSNPDSEHLSIKLHSMMTSLLCEIVLSCSYFSLKLNHQVKYPDPVKVIIKYIEQNYFRKITIDVLAKLTYLNKSYLIRLFKKHTGYAPIEFINKFRLEYSRQLLLSEHISVEQVAMNLGFGTHSYFTKCFKREYSITPTEYISRK